MTQDYYYPGLDYPANELSAYILVMNVYIISRRNGKLIRFTPADPGTFKNWLHAHGVRPVMKNNAAIDNAIPKYYTLMN